MESAARRYLPPFPGQPEKFRKVICPKGIAEKLWQPYEGKKPKDREKYIIRLGGGILVEVNREVYLEWYRSKRQERYQKERERKYGVCSLEGLREKGYFPETDMYVRDVTQEAVFKTLEKDKLWYALRKLPEQDALLVGLLYFEEVTVKETAEILGCSRKTVRNRREKILKELGRQLVD